MAKVQLQNHRLSQRYKNRVDRMIKNYSMALMFVALAGCTTKQQESSIPWEDIIKNSGMENMVQKEHIRCFRCETGNFPVSTDQLEQFKSTIPACHSLTGANKFSYYPLSGNLKIDNFINRESGLHSFAFSKNGYDPKKEKPKESFIIINIDPKFFNCADLLARNEQERLVLEALEQYPGVSVKKAE